MKVQNIRLHCNHVNKINCYLLKSGRLHSLKTETIMPTLEFNAIDKVSAALKPVAIKLTKDTEQANDLMQETLIKAFVNREKFKEGTNLQAWLYTIMKNIFITNYQRIARRKTLLDQTDNQHILNSSDKTIENKAYSNFAMEEINAAIDKVKNIYRIPFKLYFKGFKYQEIAEALDIPIGTVKNRIHMARQMLKGSLKQYAYLEAKT